MAGAVLAWCLGGGFNYALAADKPVVAPPESWVKLVTAPVALAGGSASAAIQVLLTDWQLNQAAAGLSVYNHSVLRAQTPQGLGALGSLQLSWNPNTDVLTLHQYQIRRGDQVIDLLPASQPFTILRRERNLEAATLDGTLTVTLQPPGLQVGDVLETAYTLTRNDPVLQGQVGELFTELWIAPAARVHVRATWPRSQPLRWRATDGLDKPKTAPGELSLDMRDVAELHGPEGAPARYFNFRQLEFSSYASWAELSAQMAALFAEASVLAPDSPLNAEVARIRAVSGEPKVRAGLALALVEDQVRYLFLGMNNGALVPAAADLTWTRRFGDCKGKTALLLALLHALDIPAEPALVSTAAGDGMDARLPMPGLFDHVLVRAHIDGHDYWLDGTREGDAGRDLDRLPVPYFHWALPLLPEDGALVPLVPPALDEPSELTTLTIDASAGITMPVHVHGEKLLTGDGALEVKRGLDNLSAEARDRALRNFWTKHYPTLQPKTVGDHFDVATGRQTLVVDGEQTLEWKRLAATTAQYLQLPDGELGWKADAKRQPGPHQDAPYAVSFPYYERTRKTVILPSEALGATVHGSAVDKTVMEMAFHRDLKVERNIMILDVSTRALKPEYVGSTVDADTAAAEIRSLSEEAVYLMTPLNYRGTAKEQELFLAKVPQTPEGLVGRADILFQRGDKAGALADVEKAITLRPDWAPAYGVRGYIRMEMGDAKAAQADFDKALILDPACQQAMNGNAQLALNQGRNDDTILLTTRMLQLWPTDFYALGQRMQAYYRLQKPDQAFADATELKRLDPNRLDAYQVRANVLRQRGEMDAMLAEGEAAIAARPNDAEAYALKGVALEILGRKDEAVAVYDRALALKPTAPVYAQRARARPASDQKGKVADLTAALALDPNRSDYLTALGMAQARLGDNVAAEATFNRALSLASDKAQGYALINRGRFYADIHRDQQAREDFAKARDKVAGQAAGLNSLCWEQATAGFALDTALADCDAALKLQPTSSSIQDSRAFVLLRLGRYDEAIAQYDEALKDRATSGASLYGRGLAKLRKGMAQEGQADLTAARANAAGIDDTFKDYGVIP
ncbi:MULTISPECIES: DUF3857 domain-containing protein [Nitrospirillum]|uniref:DUF3857 domain-containing protein n=1 Tax=Nitrospirillum amazonense TaxID=28077 RepID=UPI00164677D6|nr:DUF3857 domain-containing protein [Nitrospirillum amazonense]MEC4589377.1 DUF3857 domain-containing protein [Nitrospirillum amazonense]